MKTWNSAASFFFAVGIATAVSTGDLAAQERQRSAPGGLSPQERARAERGEHRDVSARAITRVVQQRFQTDYSLLADHLHVTTRDGVVTLSGRVPHLLARERAVDIAAAVPGVVAVKSQIDVLPVQRSSSAIKRDVEQALAADPATDSYALEVSVDEGVVTLTGTADSWQEKQLAGKVAKSVRGVKEIENRINVEFRRDRPDRDIAADIRTRLRNDAHVDERLIDVAVENGHVTLSGVVATPLEKRVAVADAWVLNVNSVDASDLRVDPSLRGPLERAIGRGPQDADARGSADLARRVESQLQADPEITTENIDVRARNGNVVISGQVRTLLDREQIIDMALGVPGVRTVQNEIRVVTPERADAEIRQALTRALAQTPAVDGDEIRVNVRNGKVILRGTTDSWVERDTAEEVAMGIPGVKAVESHIDVSYPAPRRDAEIESDIFTRFQRHPRIDAESIDVDVWNGLVVLSGTVKSPMTKARAAANAWVAGVRAVDARNLNVNRIGLGTARPPVEHGFARDRQLGDREIREGIQSALLYNPYVLSSRPEVRVRNGIVTLTGEVGSLRAKQEAEEVAERILGVRQVINRLVVKPEGAADDRQIEQAIRQAYLRDPVVEIQDIAIEARGGQVRLMGTVHSEFERQQAEELASRINGVVEVLNDLEVRAVPTGSDTSSSERIGSQAEDLLQSRFQQRRYPRAAGLVRVDAQPGPFFDFNFFAVKSDEEIREDIEDQLFWSPLVDDSRILVTVEDGVATLRGTVDSVDESSVAEANAFDGGAIAVRNLLRVGI